MTGKLKEVLRLSGGWMVSFILPDDPRKDLDGLQDQQLSIEAKKISRKRSMDANRFCWALCSDIGKALTPPVDKEEIYRRAIRAVGVYTAVKVVLWDVQTLTERWTAHGTGWFVDIVDDAGMGRKLVHLYYGSSTYTTQEMSLLIDWLVDQAEQMGIKIPLGKADRERLLAEWERASSKKAGNVTSAAV